ncbi:MAG: type II toxin-antitoxin system PemK/MazF family toxin [Ilumatobacteraceae bacterium]
MVIRRGDVWWADLGPPDGSGPGHRRPVVVVSSDAFNRSRISTVAVAIVTSNTALAAAPGNVLLSADSVGLDRDSVINVSQVTTLEKRSLTQRAGQLGMTTLDDLDAGLRLALGLS